MLDFFKKHPDPRWGHRGGTSGRDALSKQEPSRCRPPVPGSRSRGQRRGRASHRPGRRPSSVPPGGASGRSLHCGLTDPRQRRCQGGGCMLRAHRASVADGKPEGAVTVWKNQTRNDRLRPRSHEKLKPGAASLDVGDLEGSATSGFGHEAGGSQRRGARASLKSCG